MFRPVDQKLRSIVELVNVSKLSNELLGQFPVQVSRVMN